MPIAQVDTVVIGAGIAGLAIARELALTSRRKVYVLEQHSRSGEEVSSHNSGVVHAGIYYPRDSLKTRLCIEGNQRLYAYAAEKGIACKAVGKCIVAKQAQKQQLQAVYEQALNNGVQGLSWLDRSELKQLEPNVEADFAIHSATTGIIDAPALVAQLEFDALEAGVELLFKHQVHSIQEQALPGLKPGKEQGDDGYYLNINAEFVLQCRCVINAAGLHAARLANYSPAYFAQGQYYQYQAKAPFQRLIYPLPEPNQQGLGVHSTIDLTGQLQFGPDLCYQTEIDYTFDESRQQAFVAAIRRYFPTLDAAKLRPGQVGVRPKLTGPGASAEDFKINLQHHGSACRVDLLGIESPGLTACLAIGDYVRTLLHE